MWQAFAVGLLALGCVASAAAVLSLMDVANSPIGHWYPVTAAAVAIAAFGAGYAFRRKQ